MIQNHLMGKRVVEVLPTLQPNLAGLPETQFGLGNLTMHAPLFLFDTTIKTMPPAIYSEPNIVNVTGVLPQKQVTYGAPVIPVSSAPVKGCKK